MAARLPLHLRMIRHLLQRLNYHFGSGADYTREPFQEETLRQAEEALRRLPLADNHARSYFEKHIPRLARTLALIPRAEGAGRALELGCYMQLTPFLQRLRGYTEVRGVYYGPLGRTDHKIVQFPDGMFTCAVDLFDVERDTFPYPDEHFDLVIAGEIIEHLIYDPMHMLLEARRVLRDRGHLVITTPNAGSVTSVARALEGRNNPQVFSLYKRPDPDEQPEIGHVREYTAYEIAEAVKAAGFEVQSLFTTFVPEFATYLPLLRFLQENGYGVENRGEQTYCLAVKRASLTINRYPSVIYSNCSNDPDCDKSSGEAAAGDCGAAGREPETDVLGRR